MGLVRWTHTIDVWMPWKPKSSVDTVQVINEIFTNQSEVITQDLKSIYLDASHQRTYY